LKILAIHEQTVPLAAPMRNASVAYDTMTASALAVVSDCMMNGEPVVGFAFDSIGRYGKGGLLRDRFIPRLLAASPGALLDSRGRIDPDAAVAALMENEKDGGHGERPGAVGLIDAALWDLRAKLEAKPLWRVLAERAGQRAPGQTPTFDVYGSCGHFRPGRGTAELDGLAREVQAARAAGFSTIKIKLGGRNTEDDLARTRVALAAGEGVRVAVDVNGKLDAAIESAWLQAMASLDVAWVEEPASPLDYLRLSKIAASTPVPLATGENLFSLDDARNLLRYGGLRPDRDLIQIDISLSYGVGEYLRIVSEFEAAGWPRAAFAPHAGHLFAAQAVAGLALGCHESASDLSLPFGGLWDGAAITGGRAAACEAPGVGFELKNSLYQWLKPLAARDRGPVSVASINAGAVGQRSVS
jgi:L-alanine-DL-glutamate epimerase-like enolase superfamily enzyme